MKIIKTVKEIKEYLTELKYLHDKSIGLVPTMGALHEAHLSLIRASKNDADISVCSIFVNPTQFNNVEDLKNYPNTLEKDLDKLEKAHCDVVFLPSVEEIYAKKTILNFDFGTIVSGLEGKHRPGHFNGVALIISKLFNIVEPDKAYFGDKDFQQLAVIRCLNEDLGFGVEVVGCETLREKNGLAMSSRNLRLSPEAKSKAAILFENLNKVKEEILNGVEVHTAVLKATNSISSNASLNLEYLEVVDGISICPVSKVKKGQKLNIAIAAFIEEVRLIDNIAFTV